MNVRNILNLLQEAFNYPQYNIDSAINDDEKAFVSQLENIIKDSIDFVLTFENYIPLYVAKIILRFLKLIQLKKIFMMIFMKIFMKIFMITILLMIIKKLKP